MGVEQYPVEYMRTLPPVELKAIYLTCFQGKDWNPLYAAQLEVVANVIRELPTKDREALYSSLEFAHRRSLTRAWDAEGIDKGKLGEAILAYYRENILKPEESPANA